MVRCVYVPYNDKIWFDYYHDQAQQVGHGLSGYQGIPYQRGNGLGSFFGRLFRAILPVAKRAGKSALKTVGREALNMGTNVMADMAEGRDIKESFKQHGLKAGRNVIDKAETAIRNQSGGRIGKRKVVSTVKSVNSKKPRLQQRKKKTCRQPDIFTSDGEDN